MLQVFAPYGRAGASARVRVFQWLEHVGVEHRLHDYVGTSSVAPRVLIGRPVSTLRREIDARRRLPRNEDVLIHRAVTPFSRGEVERRLLTRSRLGVYDFDDAIQWEPSHRNLPRRIFPGSSVTLAAVCCADRVIAGNAVLAEWAAGHNHDVRVIPSCVEPAYYARKRDYRLHDPPQLGWVGSASTEGYLDAIVPALLEVHRRTGAVLVRVGAATARPPGPLDVMVRRVRWTETVVHNRAADWDIGLMPLADGLYERGKCGYKLLQYGAAALPVIGSPVGVNRELLDAMRGLAPATPADWVDAIMATLDAPACSRAAAGDQARTVVETGFSYAAWESEWRDAVGRAQLPTVR